MKGYPEQISVVSTSNFEKYGIRFIIFLPFSLYMDPDPNQADPQQMRIPTLNAGLGLALIFFLNVINTLHSLLCTWT